MSISILSFSTLTSAQSRIEVQPKSCEFEDTSILGIPVWYKYLEGKSDLTIFEDEQFEGKCQPVLSEDGEGFIDPRSGLAIGLAVLEAMMTVAGMVAVVMIFWGSFNFVLSEGQSDKAASARKTVINAAIGLVIIIVATRIVSFIANTLTVTG